MTKSNDLKMDEKDLEHSANLLFSSVKDFINDDKKLIKDIKWFLTHAYMYGRIVERIADMPEIKTNAWQPIATAPKDGTCILVDNISLRNGFDVVSWENHKGGNWFVNGTTLSRFDATHWMPLPKRADHEK